MLLTILTKSSMFDWVLNTPLVDSQLATDRLVESQLTMSAVLNTQIAAFTFHRHTTGRLQFRKHSFIKIAFGCCFDVTSATLNR